MSKDTLVVGLDIGTAKIRVAVGETIPDGTLEILGIAESPSAGVYEGEVIDVDATVARVRETITEAGLKSQVQIRGVYLAVTGTHIHSFNTRGVVMLPADREKIGEQDIEQARTNANRIGRFKYQIVTRHYPFGPGFPSLSIPPGGRSKRLCSQRTGRS